MNQTAVVSFADTPLSTAERRLADLPDRVVEGDPHHETRMYFESPDGKLVAGTWTSTPGKWHLFTGRDEFCTLLAGRVQLIDTAGNVREFVAGDAFMIPHGFDGYWHVIETATKHFVIRHHDAV